MYMEFRFTRWLGLVSEEGRNLQMKPHM
jgi:hypothetical protein